VPDEARLDGRYQLDERVAAGGYGEVWRATDLILGRKVAVKLLLAQHVQQAETLARFRAEAQRAGALTQANIARVYDYVEPNPPQPPFLVMELIDGPSLAQVLADGPLPPAQVMDIIAGAAAGLQAAHDAGLVHRDIKPANLLLTRDGTVKVTDFGISYAAGSAPMTASGMLVGTAGYMAPERLGGGPVTGAADLYALGIVGYEALAGQPPFTGTPLEVAVKHRDQPLPPLPASVPPGAAALVEALIAKDPAARPASAGDVAQWATHEHNMLVSATRTDLPAGLTPPIGYAGGGYSPTGGGYPPTSGGYPPSGGGYGPTGGRTAPAAAGSTAAWGAAPPGTQPSYGPPYGPSDPSSGLPPDSPGSHAGPPRRRRGLLIAALAAVVVVAAAAIGLVLAHSGGSGSPGPVVKTSLTPSATSSTTAPAGNGGGAQPTQASSAPASRPTTAPTHQATTAPPTTAPTTTTPTTTAPTPTVSAAATTSPTAAATGGGQGDGGGTGNGGNQGGGSGGGQGTGKRSGR
jgi:eukaryotic-like serine/threonine-protein kinase